LALPYVKTKKRNPIQNGFAFLIPSFLMYSTRDVRTWFTFQFSNIIIAWILKIATHFVSVTRLVGEKWKMVKG